MAQYVGIHVILDLYKVKPEKISYVKTVKKIFDLVVKEAKLTKIAARYHQFKPYGVTGIILLAESHISIHSWPEHELATIDIYTCGDFNKAHIASNLLISLLQPEYYEKTVLYRGNITQNKLQKPTEMNFNYYEQKQLNAI